LAISKDQYDQLQLKQEYVLLWYWKHVGWRSPSSGAVLCLNLKHNHSCE
jgi:hypothetical protein